MTVETIGTLTDTQEQQITFHQAESIRLKRLFNERSLFNAKLPPEILMLIFLEYARSFHRRYLESCGSGSRKVALDCAEMWTLLVLDERIHPALYKTILERSCGLPLTIIFHATHNSFCCAGRCQPEALRAFNYAKAMDVFRRVFLDARNITVFIDRDDHAEVWEVLGGLKQAQRLQSLCIETVDYMRPHGFDHPPNVSVPDDLVAPSSLRSLQISGVVFRWSNTLLGPDIRHLDLSHHYFRVLSSMDELLSALQRMQQLETLLLDQVPSEASLPEGYSRRVTLPCLRRVRIPLKSAASSTLLSFMQLPPTTSVHFFRKPRQSLPNEKKLPERTIAAHVKAAVDILKDLDVYAIDESCFSSLEFPSCKLWAAPPHDVDASASRPWREIGATPCRLEFDASLKDPVMAAVLAAIDLRRVHTVSIREDSSQARSLLESVRGAENLTTLRLSRAVCLPIGAVLAGWRRPPSMNAGVDPGGDDDDYLDSVPDWYGYGDPADGDRILDEDFHDDSVACAPASDGASQTAAISILPLFPRLRTLHLSQFDFPVSGRRSHSPFRFYKLWFECWNDVEYGLDVRGLVKAVRTRVARGAEEVVRIELDDCQCRERERLVPLVEVVPEVWLEGKRVTAEELGSSDA